MKPAVKTMPSTGWTTQPKQPINKTIGINKLGTLLSSQTTDTPGTTQTKRSRIAPEQLFKLTRSPTALQTGVLAEFQAMEGSPPKKPARKSAPFFRPFNKGVGRYLSASAAATRTTLHTNPTQNKSTPRNASVRHISRNFAVLSSRWEPGEPSRPNSARCGVAHAR